MLFAKSVPLLLSILLLVPSLGQAQRRGKASKQEQVRITLPFSVLFGDVHVPKGTYRVSTSDGNINLLNPRTMLTVATVKAKQSGAKQAVKKPTGSVKTKGDKVSITIQILDQVYTAAGERKAYQRKGPKVTLRSNSKANLDDSIPKEPTQLEIVAETLNKRYIQYLKDCIDKAQKSRWQTDDPRFHACVCPVAERWRLLRPKTPLRIHHPIAKGKFGMSFTLTEKGRVTQCRVWTGAKPPADEFKKVETPPAP